jgi:hypothetical protein
LDEALLVREYVLRQRPEKGLQQKFEKALYTENLNRLKFDDSLTKEQKEQVASLFARAGEPISMGKADRPVVMKTLELREKMEFSTKEDKYILKTNLSDPKNKELKETVELLNEAIQTVKKNATGGGSLRRSQKTAISEILQNPEHLLRMATGQGKTTVISPILNLFIHQAYREVGIKHVDNILPDLAKANQSFEKFAESLGGKVEGASSDPLRKAKVRMKIGGIEKEFTAIMISASEEIKSKIESESLLNEIKDADFIFTDIHTAQSHNMDSILRTSDKATQIYDEFAKNSWAIYDEAHKMSNAPHLIIGSENAKPMTEAQYGTLKSVDDFIKAKFEAWKNSRGSNENKAFTEFAKSLETTKYVEKLGDFSRPSETFQEEFKNSQLRGDNKGKDFTYEEKAALLGFADALTMFEKDPSRGFALAKGADGVERICPVQDGQAAPNMYWSHWNIAGARELIGARMLEREPLKLNEVRTSPESIRITPLSIF